MLKLKDELKEREIEVDRIGEEMNLFSERSQVTKDLLQGPQNQLQTPMIEYDFCISTSLFQYY
jgi:hypothetical protein